MQPIQRSTCCILLGSTWRSLQGKGTVATHRCPNGSSQIYASDFAIRSPRRGRGKEERRGVGTSLGSLCMPVLLGSTPPPCPHPETPSFLPLSTPSCPFPPCYWLTFTAGASWLQQSAFGTIAVCSCRPKMAASGALHEVP